MVVGDLMSCMVIGAKSKNPAIWVMATQFKAYGKILTSSQTNTIDDRL
ncbi:hypothetical protein Hanom_Chr04g00338451 [Helianthus anomalus]